MADPSSALPTTASALKALAESSGWDASLREATAHSVRRSWQMACAALAFGVMGFGYGLFSTLRPAPDPVVLMLDRATGTTTVLPKLDGKSVPQVVALDHHNAAQYVRAREGYNYSMLGRDYDQVARMSTPETWAPYAKRFMGPEAQHEKVADRELHRVTIIGVRLASGYAAGRSGEALVTYEREVRSSAIATPSVTRYVATLRYEYRPTAMKRDVDRLENPFGYVVTAYRTDAEVAASRVEGSTTGSMQ